MIALAWLLAASAVATTCPEAPRFDYDGKTFTATFCPKESGWVGATLRRSSDGHQFDLPVRQGRAGEPVTLSAEVGPGYVQVVLAVWEENAPCERGAEARHGCREYGYVVDGLHDGSDYPAWAYERRYHAFHDLTPRRIRVLDAGAGADTTAKVREAVEDGRVEVVDGGKAGAPRTHIEVLYRDKWERGSAWELAASLRAAEAGVHWTVRHWPDASDTFVIAVGTE